MADYIVHKAIELDNLSSKVRSALTDTDWIISPKYDGCHVVFLFENGEHVDTRSRTGEVVQSMAHIGRHLLDVYPALKSADRVAVCGEAWAFGKEFNEISGLFRRQYPAPELWFVPFDCVPWDRGAEGMPLLGVFNGVPYPTPYRIRIGALLDGYTPSLGAQVVRPRTIPVAGDLSEVFEAATFEAKRLKALTTGAYDGAVLARAEGRYQVGSGKGGEFIKCKPLLSFTVTVTGAALDFGTKTGKNTAALKFMLDGLEQKVSTGLTQQQVEEITAVGWDGYRIEVEAMGKTVNGYLREPRFRGIRYDA